MSDTPPPVLPPVPTPDQARSGCMTAFMVIAGIILLLPGLCALFFAFAGVATSASDLQMVGVCLIVACGGVGLIWAAIRGRPR
jgi:hypothetical protein